MKVFIPYDEYEAVEGAPVVPFDRSRMQVVAVTSIGECNDGVCEIMLELGAANPPSNAQSKTGYGSGSDSRTSEL